MVLGCTDVYLCWKIRFLMVCDVMNIFVCEVDWNIELCFFDELVLDFVDCLGMLWGGLDMGVLCFVMLFCYVIDMFIDVGDVIFLDFWCLFFVG